MDDGDIVWQTTIADRAQWQLDRLASPLPSYTITIDPDMWNSPDDLWLGDLTTISVSEGRLQVEDQQLRVTQMQFDIADDDSMTITATVGFRPRNLIGKVFEAKSRLDKLERL